MENNGEVRPTPIEELPEKLDASPSSPSWPPLVSTRENADAREMFMRNTREFQNKYLAHAAASFSRQ